MGRFRCRDRPEVGLRFVRSRAEAEGGPSRRFKPLARSAPSRSANRPRRDPSGTGARYPAKCAGRPDSQAAHNATTDGVRLRGDRRDYRALDLWTRFGLGGQTGVSERSRPASTACRCGGTSDDRCANIDEFPRHSSGCVQSPRYALQIRHPTESMTRSTCYTVTDRT